MHLLQTEQHTRRAFLARMGQLAATGAALPTALNLAALGEAAAADATDYKALVCVFLYGGNDYANTVVTYDAPSYQKYASIRGGTGETGGGITLPRAQLAPTVLRPQVALPEGRTYALHPAMGGLAQLFNQGQAAALLNVGPLLVPLTKAQFNSADRKKFPLPPKLFSHNDQQSVWQSWSAEGSTAGWGGHLGDLVLQQNARSLFTCMSVTGNAVFLSGQSALQYQVGTGGAVKVRAIADKKVYGSSAVSQLLSEMVNTPGAHPMERAYTDVMRRSREAEVHVAAALATSSSGAQAGGFQSHFPSGNPLADQLKMVARLIQGREVLGVRRQVFMVSLGGFDLHDNLMEQQPVLLQRVSEAMSAFYKATETLGVSRQVTTFTASDFGRTLTSNGDGSDHGWGSHHLVVGGAVKGQRFYGTAPPVSVGVTSSPEDQWHVGQGRLLPTTSVDQYGATLGRWFGAGPEAVRGVFPNLQRFANTEGYPADLGFMGV